MKTYFSTLMEEAWDAHQNGWKDAAFEKLYSAVHELSKQIEKSKRLPDSMQQAFNEGDGSYKP